MTGSATRPMMNTPRIKTVQTRHGPMRALAGDRFITPCLEVYGEYSRQEWLLLEQIAKPGMTVVEAGANIGVHTIPLARACAPGVLFAFEPQMPIFALLCENLKANQIGNVRPIPAACGAQIGTGTVPSLDYSGAANFGGVSILADGEPGQAVRIQTIDAFNLQECGLIKIDVEGFELSVVQGASDTIKKCRPVIYIENDRVENQEKLISCIGEMKYRMYWHVPYLYDSENFNGATGHIFGQRIYSINMLCIPSERNTRVERLEEIDPNNWSSPKGRKLSP